MKTESFRLGSEIKIRILDCCTVCEFCVDACPDVFAMGNVLVAHIPLEMNDLINEIVQECPVKAIVKG